MPYSLDDAHDTLMMAALYLDRINVRQIPMGIGAIAALVPCRFSLRAALDAIEAELPEPCPECGSDQCSNIQPDDLMVGAVGTFYDGYHQPNTGHRCEAEKRSNQCP